MSVGKPLLGEGMAGGSGQKEESQKGWPGQLRESHWARIRNLDFT